VSHGEYADGTDRQTDGRTDGRTPDRYITLSARRRRRNNSIKNETQSETEDFAPVTPLGELDIFSGQVHVGGHD